MTATVDADGLVHIEGDGFYLAKWNHHPASVRAALERFDGLAEWEPGYHLLLVPISSSVGGGQSVFGIDDPDGARGSSCCATR